MFACMVQAVELQQDPPEPTAHDRLLLLRRGDLLRYYKSSPYYIDTANQPKAAAAVAGGSIDEVEKYSDRYVCVCVSVCVHLDRRATQLLVVTLQHGSVTNSNRSSRNNMQQLAGAYQAGCSIGCS